MKSQTSACEHQSISIIIICFFFAFFVVMSVTSEQVFANDQEETVVEHIRVKVPEKTKEAWLNAEKQSWGTWLMDQKGFLGRQLFWDKTHEEATILISWTSRKAWKDISQKEIEEVQYRFEKFACEQTGCSRGNPFPLTFEGELQPQL